MHHRKFAMVTSLLLVAAFLISACALSVTPTPETPTSPPAVVESTPTTESTKEPSIEPSPTVTPLPTPCVRDPEKSTTWICLSDGREIVFSDVPGGTAVRMFAYDQQLLKENKEGFENILFIAGDFRFYDIESQAPVTSFGGQIVNIRIPLTQNEVTTLQKYAKLYLIQIEPGQNKPWKTLAVKPSSSVEVPAVTFEFKIWGVDPPTGLGVGN